MQIEIDSEQLLKLEKSGRFVDAVAYGGGVIYPDDFPDGLIIDLSATKISNSVPLLLAHSVYDVAGQTVSAVVDKNSLLISGSLHQNNEFADVIKSENNWQLSIGVFAKESRPAAEKEVVNGLEVSSPITVWRGAVVKEVSVTHYPVDNSTSINFFSRQNGVEKMPEDNTAIELLKKQVSERDAEIVNLNAVIAEKDKVIADLTAANTALTAEISALKTAANEVKLSRRNEKLLELCKKRGKDEKPDGFSYLLDLSEDSFNKTVEALADIPKPTLPDNFKTFSHSGEKSETVKTDIFERMNKGELWQ